MGTFRVDRTWYLDMGRRVGGSKDESNLLREPQGDDRVFRSQRRSMLSGEEGVWWVPAELGPPAGNPSVRRTWSHRRFRV